MIFVLNVTVLRHVVKLQYGHGVALIDDCCVADAVTAITDASESSPVCAIDRRSASLGESERQALAFDISRLPGYLLD